MGGRSTVERIEVRSSLGLEDYAAVAHLSDRVARFRERAAVGVPVLRGRTVWMVNSTERGGGVAEMLPRLVALLRAVGVAAEWAVLRTERPGFFELTKTIHNLVHDAGPSAIPPGARALYEEVSRELAESMRALVRPGDVLVVHDPQPLGMGALVRESADVVAVWRCHIGYEGRTERTRLAWDFLEPWARRYDRAVFTAAEYIPDFLAGRATIIHPGIDPLSHKNRELSAHKLMGILCNAGLAREHAPVLTPPFEHRAERLYPDGSLGPACGAEEIGLAYRPTVLQVSRWDRLKGWHGLMEAFVRVKAARREGESERHRRRRAIVRLVLAGPEPTSIQDDPEGLAVFDELREAYLRLPPEMQADIVLLTLPMRSRKENALMVNALQRCASVAVQSSLREGFGLTATEAMWKRAPVLASAALGLRVQIRDGLEGRLVGDPEDASALAAVLDEMLADPVARERWGRNAQRRVHEEFLVFRQLERWIETLADCVRA